MKSAKNALLAVMKEYSVAEHTLLSTTRGLLHAAGARQVAMYLAYRTSPQPSYTEVGRFFGRDRTTVRHAVEKVTAFLRTDTVAARRIKRLEKHLVSPASTV